MLICGCFFNPCTKYPRKYTYSLFQKYFFVSSLHAYFSVKLIVVGDFFLAHFLRKSSRLVLHNYDAQVRVFIIIWFRYVTILQRHFHHSLEKLKKNTFHLGCHSTAKIVSITILLHRSLGMNLKLFLIWIAILEKFSRLICMRRIFMKIMIGLPNVLLFGKVWSFSWKFLKFQLK